MKAKMKKVLMKEIDRVSYPFSYDVRDDRKKQLELVYCCQNMVVDCYYKQGVLTVSEYYMIDGLLFQISTLLENNLCKKEDIKNISKKYLIKNWLIL